MTIKLTESDLHKIVKECARRALNEIGDTPKGQYMLGRTAERARRRDDGATCSLARNKAHWARQGNDKLHRAHEVNGELDQSWYQEVGAKPTYAEMYESINRTIKKAVNESINRVLSEAYTTEQQWNDEIRIFMKGIKNGDFEVFGNGTIGVEWKMKDWPKNDPRFIVFKLGDNRLHDDHFYVQSSPVLSEKQLKVIRDVLVRSNIISQFEFDEMYGFFDEY